MPERRPRQKQNVEHFGHRVAMLNRALQPHPRLHVLELNDQHFSVKRTLPVLVRRFAGGQLVFLFGSDVIQKVINWPESEQLLQRSEFVVGLRKGDDKSFLRETLHAWPTQPKALTIVSSYAPHVSSQKVRNALRNHLPIRGLLRSVSTTADVTGCMSLSGTLTDSREPC